MDPITEHHHVVAFDNRGVGGAGEVPGTIEEAAEGACAFFRALGADQLEVVSLSMGTTIARELVGRHPSSSARAWARVREPPAGTWPRRPDALGAE